jgi:hypothetical protein
MIAPQVGLGQMLREQVFGVVLVNLEICVENATEITQQLLCFFRQKSLNVTKCTWRFLHCAALGLILEEVCCRSRGSCTSLLCNIHVLYKTLVADGPSPDVHIQLEQHEY